MVDDWSEPPEVIWARFIYGFTAPISLMIGLQGLVSGNPVEVAVLPIALVLGAASMLAGGQRSWHPALSRLAAVGGAIVWVWLPLVAASADLISAAIFWLIGVACLRTARWLAPAQPDALGAADGRRESAPTVLGWTEGWIEELELDPRPL